MEVFDGFNDGWFVNVVDVVDVVKWVVLLRGWCFEKFGIYEWVVLIFWMSCMFFVWFVLFWGRVLGFGFSFVFWGLFFLFDIFVVL